MADSSNGTGQDAPEISCMPYRLQVLLWVISALLVLSLLCNIFCCVSKCCSGKGKCQTRIRRRRGQRQMEENPIYGNISYMQTSMTLFPEADPQPLPLSSSSLRDRQRVLSDSQDCYANLTLKAPRQQSGCVSPQIQYSDVVLLESEKEDEGNTDAHSTMSDLYSSVQTQRTKTVHAAGSGEEYANHL